MPVDSTEDPARHLWRHQSLCHNSLCPESQSGRIESVETSSLLVERFSVAMEGESYHLQNPRPCIVINSNNVTLFIQYYGVRSLIPKHDKLCATVEAHNPDVACIVETWLWADILYSEIGCLPRHQVQRRGMSEVFLL